MLMRGIGDIVLESPHHGCVPHHPVSNITSSCNQPYPPTPQLTSKAPSHTEIDADATQKLMPMPALEINHGLENCLWLL